MLSIIIILLVVITVFVGWGDIANSLRNAYGVCRNTTAIHLAMQGKDVKSLTDELEQQLADLKKLKASVKAQETSLRAEKELFNKLYDKNECDVAIDLSKFISVERDKVGQTTERTCVGYSDETGKLDNWWLDISRDQHNDLVKQFREFKAKNETYS
jgi:hypothetical protein